MPEMLFRVRWPDGQEERCYSPSLVVRDYLTQGVSYPVEDFVMRCRQALLIASERVEKKYGRPCGLALDQLKRIEARAEAVSPALPVTVLAFEG